MQLPDVLLAALAVWALWSWAGLPGWAAGLAFAIWVAKDVALYPLLRGVFVQGPSKWVGVARLLGAVGVVTQELSPHGWVRVSGELWRARSSERDGPLLPGVRVRVLEVRGMTLLIEPDAADTQSHSS